ncbi:MAG: DUF1329 domain-containing protein [Myxococcota bacterium]
MPALALALAGVLLLAVPAAAVQVPPEGACPPYAVPRGEGPVRSAEDLIPPGLVPGEVLDLDGIPKLRRYLPQEVWARRDAFFYEGMSMEVGPCHRRYPAPPFFEAATRANAGVAEIDAEGNLRHYSGQGMPFPIDSIADDAPDAGQRWAWDVRYRYLGAGFRGKFRIIHLERRGRKVERFRGTMTFLPLHGVPGEPAAENRFAWAGRFSAPEVARGVAWRQYRSAEADRDWNRSDQLFVYVPEERRVRRAPPRGVDGLFMPSYTRGFVTGGGKLILPMPETSVSTPAPSIAVAEHWRRGFVGLMFRPNAYRFKLVDVRDVIAPINSKVDGYPTHEERSYGPSGLSLASDRWEIRRAVVLEGRRKKTVGNLYDLTLWVDALTAQPLYLISHRSRGRIFEVGIFMSRFSGDAPAPGSWDGSGPGFGALLPVAESFWVIADQSWLRDSFALEANPLSPRSRKRVLDSFTLQKEGR